MFEIPEAEPDLLVVSIDGRVLYMGARRFVEDVVKGGYCFVCGAAPGSKSFDSEHVVPRWILRRFNLHSRTVRIPNGEGLRYGGYTIPCCKECNRRLGTRVETPISQLLAGNYKDVCLRMNQAQEMQLFLWLATLFLKTHLRDLNRNFSPDPREATGPIGGAYDWGQLHHLHCLARAHHTECSIGPEVRGSMLVLPMHDTEGPERFDYADLYLAQTVLVRIGGLAILAVLNDGGGAMAILQPFLDLVRGPVTVLQLRELFCRLAVANMELKHRPSFTSEFAGGAGHISANLPTLFEPIDERDPVLFGRVFDQLTYELVEGAQIENPAAVREQIRSGGFTFFVGPDGELLTE